MRTKQSLKMSNNGTNNQVITDTCKSSLTTSPGGLILEESNGQQVNRMNDKHLLRERSPHIPNPPSLNNHHRLTRPQLTKHPNSKDCQLWLLRVNQRPEERRQSSDQRVNRSNAAVSFPLVDRRCGRAKGKQTWIRGGPIFDEAHEAIKEACDDDKVE